jgi:hypothetical protein
MTLLMATSGSFMGIGESFTNLFYHRAGLYHSAGPK